MSLLEDIFLQDEANEAQELERVIEGEEFEERLRSDSDDNSEKDDEAEEEKRKVETNTAKAKRIIKNPRFVLNPARLTGPRGIQVIPEHFKSFKFKGKGHEREDLDLILKKMEHWAYRLYPKFKFEDCLKKIETLGKKRPVMVHLHKIRSDQFVSEETVVQKDSSDEDTPAVQPEEDEFDRLLQQQIELTRSTPAPNSVKKTPLSNASPLEIRLLNIPKATSSPSISEEQRERMLKSRRLAEERRLARLANASKESYNDVTQLVDVNVNNNKVKKHNRSNVIDSSDDEDNTVSYVIESAVDVHNNIETSSTSKKQESAKNDIDKITDIIPQAYETEPSEPINTTKDIQEVECDTLNHDITHSEAITVNDNIESNDNVFKESAFTTEIQDEVNQTNIDVEKENQLISEERINLVREKTVITHSDELENKIDEIQVTDVNQEHIRKYQESPQDDELMDVDFSDDF